MKVAFYTNIVSPHQMPWCRELVRLIGRENFLYVAAEPLHRERAAMGWADQSEDYVYVCKGDASDKEVLAKLEDCDVLVSTLREFELFSRRGEKGLASYYMFERWFKPPIGAARMLVPSYRKMCAKALSCFEKGFLKLLPIGIPAVQDWFRMESIFRGNVKSFFSSPLVNAARTVFAPVEGRKNMFLWSYFVKGTPDDEFLRMSPDDNLSVMWCGRMLDWKRVDTLVKAGVKLLSEGKNVHFSVIGSGPEEARLKELGKKYAVYDDDARGIKFFSSVPMEQVRVMMRMHDVYVLSSDGGEGWGAAANEAMNEGMVLAGTYEAGSTATMVSDGVNGFLYKAKDVDALAEVLRKIYALKMDGKDAPIRKNARMTVSSDWSPETGAKRLLESFGK